MKRTTFTHGNRPPRNPTNLGMMFRIYRIIDEITLRELASDVGISAASLMRMEHGYGMNAETLMHLLAWSMRRYEDRRKKEAKNNA